VLGYVADREHTVNIDGPADWRRAEQLVERLEAEAEQGA
jgi:hypothetical protein